MKPSFGLFKLDPPYFNFRLGYFSDTAVRLGIDNEPKTLALAVNVMTVLTFLECANSYLVSILPGESYGFYAFRVTSLYRCLELNNAVGGAPASAHMSGKAVDFVLAPCFTIDDFTAACEKFEMKIKFVKQYKTHIHVTFDF